MTFLLARPADDPALCQCTAALNDLLAGTRPAHLLLAVGGGEIGLLPAPGASCRIDLCEGAARARPQRRYDAAVLFRIDEPGAKEEATHLLAALRDVWARQLLVVPAGGWSGAELLGLGLARRAAFGAAEDGALEIYSFDLASYKKTPDWLNARNWANPELFGKFRW